MQRPNIGLNRSISIPHAWRTAPVQLMETLGSARSDDGHELILALGMLADGTNLAVLTYPGGARLLRSGEMTDWRPEVTTRGRQPWARHAELVDAMWSQVPPIVEKARARRTRRRGSADH